MAEKSKRMRVVMMGHDKTAGKKSFVNAFGGAIGNEVAL